MDVAAADGVVLLPLVGYDMYRIVDQRGGERAAGSSEGLLAVRLERGRHELRITRRRTGVELAGIGLSLVGLLGLAALRRA